MSHILVIGAPRNIGVAVVEELLDHDPTCTVYATVRDLSKAPLLDNLAKRAAGRVIILPLDLTSESSISAAQQAIRQRSKTLDQVWINAAAVPDISKPVRIDEVETQELLNLLATNIVGTHLICKIFGPMLAASTNPTKKFVFVSSLAGCNAPLETVDTMVRSQFGKDYNPLAGYAISKTGMNMLGRQLAFILEPQGVGVVIMNPGIVKTDVNPNGFITTKESASGMIAQVEHYKLGDVQKGMINYDGEVYGW